MAISLTKGSNISLTKQAPGLLSVTVGLGWDTRTTTGVDFDLDGSAIVCGADSKVMSGGHFVFFNNKSSPDGAVRHSGDGPRTLRVRRPWSSGSSTGTAASGSSGRWDWAT